MKKILLASTALAAFAGAAAAEVTLSGSAIMAVVGGSGSADAKWTYEDGSKGKAKFSSDTPTQFFQDVDVSFTMSGEADNGLTFGTKVDLDEAKNLDNEFDDQGVAIFIGGEFGTVTLGDTDSALDAVLYDGDELAGGLGSINDANTAHLGFNGSYLTGGDGQRLAYSYDFEGFGFVVSVEQDPDGEAGRVLGGDDFSDDEDWIWSIGGYYDWTFGSGVAHFGAGYTYADEGSIEFEASDAGFVLDDDLFLLSGESDAWGVSAAVDMENGFSGGVTYVKYDFKDYDDGDIDYWAVGLAYTFDAFTIGANYGIYDFDAGSFEGWGLAGEYDMGGGLAVSFGYGDSKFDVKNTGDYDATVDGDEKLDVDGDYNQWSLGMTMSF